MRILALCKFFLDKKLITQGGLKHSLGIVEAPSIGTVSARDHFFLFLFLSNSLVIGSTDIRKVYHARTLNGSL
jgi:hypothetical protein